MDVIHSRVSTIPSFLIVGTPRSGTTLIQRLACELPGVKVPPETDFFARFYPALFRWRFPLEGRALRDALSDYASTKNVRDAHLDPERLIERMNGRADGPLGMFAAVVKEMAGGEARIYGEKTPKHLLWWAPLTRSLPSLKLVAVVRDPRAVIASWLSTPWGPRRPDGYVLLAERWRLDQGVLSCAADILGPERCLMLHYEHVVEDPDRARTAIGTFIGADAGTSLRMIDPAELYLPRETWKSRAIGEITADRVRAWEDTLPAPHARRIEAVCHQEMVRFGYPTSLSPSMALVSRAGLNPRTRVARSIVALRYRWERQRIARTRLF